MDFIFYISQGGVATQFRQLGLRYGRCGRLVVCLVTALYYKFSTECASEKKSAICQYLTKIWTEVCGLIFYGPPCRWGVAPKDHQYERAYEELTEWSRDR